MRQDPLPYGTLDLDPQIICTQTNPKRVRCFVRGCQQTLTVPGRGITGEFCPVHRIRCHASSAGGTYAYADVRRNIIVSPEEFVGSIVGHPFKYESHRLGLERSEDALSWNVFRSLQQAGCLAALARSITGDNLTIEPFLYLWGICVSNDDFEAWDLLIAARNRFEPNLPVERPLTEPDIAMHLPGRYLILIEAKFTSANTFYKAGARSNSSSLTLDELRDFYRDPQLNILNLNVASRAARVHQQLWRNTIFAEWMAKEDHPRTRAFHVNLVREGKDQESALEFGALVNAEYRDRFQQISWEQIYKQFQDRRDLTRMRQYLETKTAGLKPAFKISPAAQRPVNRVYTSAGTL